MKGDKDTKYMTKQTMYFSDGTEITVEYKPNPNAEEIIRKVSEAQAELPQEPSVIEESVEEEESEEAPKRRKKKVE